MRFCIHLSAILLPVLAIQPPLQAQAPALPNEKEPILRLEAGGPAADVTALAFSPDGRTLYAAGWDKVVRVWKRDETGSFVPQRISYRVPIGPGLRGAINTVALSADGRWLAVGGLGVFRGLAGFRVPGLVVPSAAMTPSMRQDEGTIFMFATAKPGEARELRGHRGPVLALAFVQKAADQPPALVSAGRDWVEAKQKHVGAVRLWDLSKKAGKEGALAEFSALPDPGQKLPGLVAWRTGPGPKQVRVALAWDDGDFYQGGKLRLWDADQDRVLDSGSAEGSFNNTVAYVPEQNLLLTGSWTRKDYKGWLGKWKVAPNQPPQGYNAVAAAFLPQEGKTVFFPRALALLSSRGDGKLDSAAVVLRVEPAKEYRLLPVQLAQPKNHTLQEALLLWRGSGRIPSLATAPNGKHLAVAGSPDHAIRVYAVADLLKGQATPQVLHSIGAQIGYAGFVSKGKGKGRQLGLVLSENAKARPRALQAGDLVLDFNGRRLRSDLSGWVLDNAALARWTHAQVEAPPKGPRPAHIVVRSPDGKVTTIKLSARRVITGHALLPPRPPLNRPLLAVASVEGNEPNLWLYDVSSGDLVCEFSGHLGPITSLAFSADGRFLVSAARDQTVCLWSLVNLENFVGKRGQVRGLVVQEKDQGLAVASVAPDSPARGVLKEDDRIEGIVIGGKLRALASAPAFYDAVLTQVPGKKVTLRLTGKRAVQVPVSQAAQERTPLAVLFVTRGDRAEDREWLAWNPLGPYDSSTAKMARVLGWHFNTGKRGQPTEFTPGDAARPKERREGLLKHLIARGSLLPALEDYKRELNAKPLPPPEMALGVDGMDAGLIRAPKGTLRLRVVGASASVQWQLDGGAFQPFAEQAREEQASVYAQPLVLKRGPHTIRVRVRPRKDRPEEFTRDLSVRYVPPSPEIVPRGIVAKLQGKALRIKKPDFPLEARVLPGVLGEKVQVDLYHQHARVTPAPAAGDFSRNIKLKPGKNRIEIIAVNKDALPDTEALETSRLELDIDYVPPKPPEVVPAPLIAVDAVVPLLGEAEPGTPQTIEPGRPVIVSVPKVRLIGAIKALKVLASAQRQLDGANPVDLTGFKRNSSMELPIAETLTLHPGTQKIVVHAHTATSKKAERVVTLIYRPLLPRAELLASPAGPVFYDDGKGPPKVTLHGRLLARRDPGPPGVKLTATVLLNDTKQIPAEIAADGKTWSATIRPEGPNDRIRIKLASPWREETFGDLRLSYLRPPRGFRATVPAKSADPFLNLTAEVDSPLPLLEKSVRATVISPGLFGVKVSEVSGATVTAAAAPGKPWTVRLKVPLEPGTNTIRLEAANAEAATREPGNWTITYVPPRPLPPAPQVTLLQPAAPAVTGDFSLKVSRPQFPLRFQVRSAAALQQVVLKVGREGQPAEEKSLGLVGVRAVPDGFELTSALNLQLAPGLNTLALEARNEGGTGVAPILLVNYVPPPVQVVLQALEPRDAPGQLSPISEGADGKLSCAAPAKARLWLHGRVVWDRADARLGEKRLVSVYVNGAQQWRGELAPAQPGSKERVFKAAILLNRTRGNLIEVDLPGLELSDQAVRELVVDCRQPQPEQWLHVQIVSPDEPNERKLIDQILETLQATNYVPRQGEFKRPGFARGRLYRPLTLDVDQDVVAYRLWSIKNQIAQRARDGWPNDVVLIYYVGGESVDPRGRFVALTRGRPPRPLISRAQLEKAFADMLGVKVLLLDVARGKSGSGVAVTKVQREVSRWLDTPTRHAWLRAAWLGAGPIPPEARLLVALRAVLPLAGRLGDLPVSLGPRFRVLSERYGTLRADWYVPPPLLGLVVNDQR